MLFVQTNRFSPVIFENDVPHEKDLYFVKPEDIPTKKVEYDKFIRNYIKDSAWWLKQRNRCKKGYAVKKAVIWEGGDVFVDGINMIVQPNGDRYIPHLDYMVKCNSEDPRYGDLDITEKHYFYLNFWKISCENKFTGRKDLLHPDFTDLSWENWMLRKKSWREEKDIAWLKCRQRGMSEEEACDTGYDFLFYNDCQIAIVGGQEYYNENTFKMVKRGVYQLYNTQFWKDIKKDNDEIFSTKNTGMEVYSRTAKNNSQVCSGLNSLVKLHLEEIGIMPKGLSGEIASAVKPSIKTRGTHRTGFIVYTGTSGKFDSNSGNVELGVADIEKMLYNPDSFDLLSVPNTYDKDVELGTVIACFIPAWKFRIRDDDGNSLKKQSLEDVAKERASKKPDERAELILFEPLITQEMFNTTKGGYFGEQIIFHLNTARSAIVTHRNKQVVERGRLEWLNPRDRMAGVEWEPDNENGLIYIAEHPQRDRDNNVIPDLYNLGTDSYDFDTANTSTSKLACLAYKGYNHTLPFGEGGVYNNFVATYLDRPGEELGGREVAYDNAAKLTIYYQGYNLIEYSKILIFKYFEDIGLEGYLKPRPDFVISQQVERSEVSNKYGYPGALVPQGLKVLRDWMATTENIYNCRFEELLKAWAKFKLSKNYNCDITIGAMLCAVASENDMIQLREPSRDEIKKVMRTFRGYKTVNGILTSIYS